MFKISFGKKAPNWNKLSPEKQQLATKKLVKMIRAMGGPRYKVVSGTNEWQRERGYIEHKNEDEILDIFSRGRMLDLARNTARNSPTFNGILKQFDLNAIGNVGGKAIFAFDDKRTIEIREEFAKWTRDADFFDGLNLNTLLKIIMKTYILGGDMVLMFDDGMVEDSGKILLYEPDEIGNSSDEALQRHFGVNAHQSLGRVYNQNGRFIGAIVSRSQRGEPIFDETKSYFLKRNPNQSDLESMWLMPRNIFRISQGRGVSPTSSALATTIDLEDLCGYELAAAKKNAQTLATVLQDAQPPVDDAVIPSAFDKDTDFDSMTDEEIEEALKAEQSTVDTQTMSLDKVNAAGCIYQVLPEGYKMELLDTKHPNANMPDFIRWLAGRSAAPFGLSEQFATLTVESGDTFKANQLFSSRAFEEAQHFLEQILDWVIYRWSIWASKHYVIDSTVLGDNWLRNIKWMWPKMDELDENSYQDAVAKKLRNMTGTYQEILGADWKAQLEQTRKEIDWCKENNLPHPAFNLISGGERTGVDVMSDGTEVG